MAIDILHAFETEPPPLDFVLPGYLAGTVGCLAAAGSTGKTFWALEAAMGVCSGEADALLLKLGISTHGKAVILNAEDPAIILHHRLHNIGKYLAPTARAEVAANLTVSAVVGHGPNLMDKRWQEAVLRVAEGARLVVLDTLTRWHRSDENDNGAMSEILGILEGIAEKTGAAMLFLHHVSKGMAKDGRQGEQQASRGASSLTDNARWQAYMQGMCDEAAKDHGIDPEQRGYYVAWGGNKENYGKKVGKSWLKREIGGVLIPVDIEKEKKRASSKKKGEWK